MKIMTLKTLLAFVMTVFIIGCGTSANNRQNNYAEKLLNMNYDQRYEEISKIIDANVMTLIQRERLEIYRINSTLRSGTIEERQSRKVTKYNYNCIDSRSKIRSTRSSPFGTDCVQMPYEATEFFSSRRAITNDEEARYAKNLERKQKNIERLMTYVNKKGYLSIAVYYMKDPDHVKNLVDFWVEMNDKRGDWEIEIFSLMSEVYNFCKEIEYKAKSDEKYKDINEKCSWAEII